MTNRFMSGTDQPLCGQPVPDSQCGFRMMRRDVIPHLFCESNNYEYETEMLLIASREGFRIRLSAGEHDLRGGEEQDSAGAGYDPVFPAAKPV